MGLRLRILGAAAGGGLPQWNCGCVNCVRARTGEIPALTQSSLAASSDGKDWLVLNASPDIRDQIARTPVLHPKGRRDSPLRAILLTNGDIDHVAGLLTLREKTPFILYATREIHDVIAANPMFAALDATLVERRRIALDEPFEALPGLNVRLFSVPGKVPLYMEGETVDTQLEGEQTVGVALEADGKQAFYIPGCAALTPALRQRLHNALLVLFDGTLWRDDEMKQTGTGVKTGQRMGHMSMDGPQGSIAAFADLGVQQRIFIHINNTNPVLDPASPQRAAVEAAGWRIAQDGMELNL